MIGKNISFSISKNAMNIAFKKLSFGASIDEYNHLL